MKLFCSKVFFSENELKLAFKYKLQTVIHHQQQLQQLIKVDSLVKSSIVVWVKLDSGMNRLGFDATDFNHAVQTVKSLSCVSSVREMSHLACADDIKNAMSKRQINQFNQITKAQPLQKSMANSAGIIAWPEAHYHWVRPGIMLYGCSPMLNLEGQDHHLLPAMTLKSQLFAKKQLKTR